MTARLKMSVLKMFKGKTPVALAVLCGDYATWIDAYDTALALATDSSLQTSSQCYMLQQHTSRVLHANLFCLICSWTDLAFLWAGVYLEQVSRDVVVTRDVQDWCCVQ